MLPDRNKEGSFLNELQEIGSYQQRREFREKFIKDIPIGTLIMNTNLDGGIVDGKIIPMIATTSGGGIYEDPNCQLVNVENINDQISLNGCWTAAFVKKAKNE